MLESDFDTKHKQQQQSDDAFIAESEGGAADPEGGADARLTSDRDRESPAHSLLPPSPPETHIAPASISFTPAPPTFQFKAKSQRPKRRAANALELTRAIGLDVRHNGNAHYLCTAAGTMDDVFFVSGHTGVLLARDTNEQTVLQGHRNTIACSCVSACKRWLVTADTGADAMVAIWDATIGTAVRIYFEDQLAGAGLAQGVVAVALSHDAKYLVTLGAADGAVPTQTVAVWVWSDEAVATPLAVHRLAAGVQASNVVVSSDDAHTVVVTGRSGVHFLKWQFGGAVRAQTPDLTAADEAKFGAPRQTLFFAGGRAAVSTTTKGYAVAWTIGAEMATIHKLVKLMDCEISYATLSPDSTILVVGGVSGLLRYYDNQFRLVGWNDQLAAGAVLAISFSQEAQSANFADTFASVRSRKAAGVKGGELVLPDFIVATSQASLIHIDASEKDDRATLVLQGQDAAVYALAAHPSAELLAIAGYSGLLQLWDYQVSRVVSSCRLPPGQVPRCVTFSPDGNTLAVGFTTGSVVFLDTIGLRQVSAATNFRESSDAVTHVAFSPSGEWFATADADCCVGLFQFRPDNFQEPWFFVGKARSHFKPISDLLFGPAVAGGAAERLVSLGQDRMLVEYDLATSTFDAGVQFVGTPAKIEQAAAPTAFAWYAADTAEPLLVTANTEFKLKLNNAVTKTCRRTLLGPVYESPVQQLVNVPVSKYAHGSQLMAFSAGAKIGLALLPLDGNPHRYTGMLAHPCPVTQIAVARDGTTLFSAGGESGCVHAWAIHADFALGAHKVGGAGLDPFVALLEGGKDGQLFHDLEDHFYFAQLNHQGLKTRKPRQVSTTLPLSEVPNVLRALGYFPSEYEIANITNEVKFADYLRTQKYQTTVDLPTLLRLYVNHRPALGVSPADFTAAFAALGGSVPADKLLTMLQRHGEAMSETELSAILADLLPGGDLAAGLASPVTAESFVSNVLSFKSN